LLKRIKSAATKLRAVGAVGVQFAASRDGIAAGALAAMSYGFWCAWPPLGFIVPGAVVLCLAVVGKMRGG
jgi:hypothetical protein